VTTAAAPQSLPACRFVGSLNEMNNADERRLTALRYHLPAPVMFLLAGVAVVAIGFTGYAAGIRLGRSRSTISMIIAAMVSDMINVAMLPFVPWSVGPTSS